MDGEAAVVAVVVGAVEGILCSSMSNSGIILS